MLILGVQAVLVGGFAVGLAGIGARVDSLAHQGAVEALGSCCLLGSVGTGRGGA